MKKLLLVVSVVLSAQSVFAYAAPSNQIKPEIAKQEPCPFSKEAKAKMFDNTNPVVVASNEAPAKSAAPAVPTVKRTTK